MPDIVPGDQLGETAFAATLRCSQLRAAGHWRTGDMHKIESPQNEKFKTLLSLTTAKGLKKAGLFLLSGERLVREFLARPFLTIEYEIVTAKHAPLSAAPPLCLATALFDALDVLGTGFNILALAPPPIATLSRDELASYQPQGIELVAPIGDPGNLGALIRSAEAFGIRRVILSQEAAHPFLPKAVKASAGSVLRVPLAAGPPLRDFAARTIALDMQGTPLRDFTWPKSGFLAVGEEGAGLGDHAFMQRVSIPTEGVESLNAVVAASIAMAHRAGAV